jgi:hypothetical protein
MFQIEVVTWKICTTLMDERERVSFQANRLKLDITSRKYEELLILNEDTTRVYFKRRRHTSSCNIIRFYLLNPSKTKVNLNYICRSFHNFQEPHSVSVTKTYQLMMGNEIIVLFWHPQKHINTCCMQNVWFLNITLCGKYSKHWALKGWFTYNILY